MVNILFNKNVFESSYNNLKFTVQNQNYTYANLIPGTTLPCKIDINRKGKIGQHF